MKKLLLILVFISIGLFAISQTVTTSTATGVSYAQADLQGIFSSLGSFTEFRDAKFEYSLNSNLSGSSTINAVPQTAIVNGATATVNLTGLQPSTTYYYRLTATLWKQGVPFPVTQYVEGSIVSFTTTLGVPIMINYSSVLTSYAAYEPTTYSIHGYGDDPDHGSSDIIERGSVWNTTGNPTINDGKLVASYGNSTGYFFHEITGLVPGTNYFINVYATNNEGTGYGSVQEIKTDTEIPTTIAATSITDVSFNANWDPVIGAEGYYLDVSTASDFSSYVTGYEELDVSNVISYTVDVGITTGVTYYYQVHAYHDGGADGTPFLSDSSNVTNLTTLAGPVLTTTDPSSITKISANVGGNITDDNGSAVTERGIVWGLATGVTVADTKIIEGGTGSGVFSASMTGLTAGIQYYYNSYAINGIGTGYGDEKNFITNTIDPTCTDATFITESGFNANWDAVTGAQGYYLDVSTVSNFASYVPGYENLDVFNVTTYNVTGLSSETVYYYRVRAYHDGGDDSPDFTSGSSVYKSLITLDFEPDVQASEIMWASNDGKISLNWIDGNGEGNMLIMRDGSSVTNPKDGLEYIANPIFGSGTEIGIGTYVLYRSLHDLGTNSVEISNLVDGDVYYFKVLEYTGLDLTTNYNLEENPAGYGIGNLGSTTLPVDLIHFGAEKTGNSVIVNWITASEINNDYFVLEHSKDGKNFEEITTVDGSGNSNLLINYNYEDNRELEGTNYYRLRQVDFDGKETVFNIVPVNCGNNDELLGNVYVDNTTLNVELNSESFDATMIRLIDISGRDVQFVISKIQGPQTLKLDMSALARGIYFVRIERGDEIINKKIIF